MRDAIDLYEDAVPLEVGIELAEGLGAVGKIAEDHAEQVASAVPADALQLGGQQGRRGEPLLDSADDH